MTHMYLGFTSHFSSLMSNLPLHSVGRQAREYCRISHQPPCCSPMSTLTYIFGPNGVQLYPRDLSPSGSRSGNQGSFTRGSIRPPGNRYEQDGRDGRPSSAASSPNRDRTGTPQIERSLSPATCKNLTFEPTLLWDPSKPYRAPPPPRPKPPPPPKPKPPAKEELNSRAAELRTQAESLGFKDSTPSTRIELGLLVMTFASKPGGLQKLIKSWDTKARGEIHRGEFRLCLRNIGMSVSNFASDALFDTWDDDHGGVHACARP